MNVLMFFLGSMFGGIVGVIAMCIFSVSGRESELERQRECREADII